MNYTAIDGIRTVEDLKAEKNQPVGGGDLDRNAFLRLFTTQLQNQNPLDPMKNEGFCCPARTVFDVGSDLRHVRFFGELCEFSTIRANAQRF